MFEGLQIVNENEGFNYYVCAIHKFLRKLAVADVNQLENSANVKKPKVLTFDKFNDLKSKKGTFLKRFIMPVELSMTDIQITKKRGANWIDSRQKRVKKIKTLLSEDTAHEYLFGEGIAAKIQTLIDEGSEWRSPGAFYNAFNKYIVYGCVENAYLPFGFKHCGSNYLHIDKPGADNIKRGRNGKDNRYSVRKHRGITIWDKDNILKLLRYFNHNQIKFTPSFAFRVYQSEFEVIIHTEETENGPIEVVQVLDAVDCIQNHPFIVI